MRQRRPQPPDTHHSHRTAWKRKVAGRRPPRGGEARASGDGAVILYGWHTVKAALENPARRIRRLYATANAARRLAEDGGPRPCASSRCDGAAAWRADADGVRAWHIP